MTPFTCINGKGSRIQIATMINGRPQDNGQIAWFIKDGCKQNVTSLTKKEDVSGWCRYLGQSDSDFQLKGYGRFFLDNGSVFIGNFKRNRMIDGKLYELQSDGKHSMFQVQYDHKSDIKNEISPDN